MSEPVKEVEGGEESFVITTHLYLKNLGKLKWCKRIFFISLVFNGQNLYVVIIRPDEAVSQTQSSL